MKKPKALRLQETAEPSPNENETTPSQRTIQLRVIALSDAVSDFDLWLSGLRDGVARRRIITRLQRVVQGNFGDHRERIAGSVSELRIDYGPGYRVYYVQLGPIIVILLGGGTKAEQQQNIDSASALWENSKNDIERLAREFQGGLP